MPMLFAEYRVILFKILLYAFNFASQSNLEHWNHSICPPFDKKSSPLWSETHFKHTIFYVNSCFHGQFITALFSSLLLITLPIVAFQSVIKCPFIAPSL